MFEIQRTGDKTSSGEIGLDIRTHASPKVGQDQVSGGRLGVSVSDLYRAKIRLGEFNVVYSILHVWLRITDEG